jgi:ATP-binding cassette, subfamily B, bacterial
LSAQPPSTPRWWLRLLPYARPHWAGLLVILLLMLLQAGLAALQPWPFKLIIDHALTGIPVPDALVRMATAAGAGGLLEASPASLLLWLTVLTLFVFLANQSVSVLQHYLTQGVGLAMVGRLRSDLLDHVQRLSLGYHGRHQVGDLMRRVMNDTGCVRGLVLDVGLSRIGTVARLLIIVTVVWQLNPLLAVLVLVAAVPLGLVSRSFNRALTERRREEYRLGSEITVLAEQTLTVLPLVQGLGREDEADARFGELSRESIRASVRATSTQLQFGFSTGAVRAVCTAAVLLVGGWQVLDGSLTVGGLLVTLSYLNSLFGPLERLAYATVAFADAAASAGRVMEVLDADDRVREIPRPRALPAAGSNDPAVCMEGVVFGYEPGRPVLRGVSLSIEPGETVALVGATGSGKTTLAGLVPRLFDPWEGRVMVEGVDVREASLNAVRSRIAVVLQEAYLLPVSVADNIAFGRPGASLAEIEAAARAAQAHEFIESLPLGYETIIRAHGATLSGGERQRLAIARAFLKDAPILILDEPTSALDAATENLVLHALERLMAGRTVIVIAHRFSATRRVRRILVLHHGRIVEAGTHDELMVEGGRYRQLYSVWSGKPTPIPPVLAEPGR